MNISLSTVGSFVWTHLTNLQETSSPSKQAIRQMLSSELLRNKFNTDVRKFSRNIEASTFWDELNVGGSVESNIIFSTKSYLPRSGMVNLTLDLFGESVNLFELGARVEGFESLVESFFGPDGVLPDETVGKMLQSLRGKRAIEEKSLNQLSATFDAIKQLPDQPQGDIYLRIFGNELHTHSFKGLHGKEKESALKMLLRAAQEKEIDFTKTLSFLNARYIISTHIGLPLSLAVNGTATVQLQMGSTFQIRSMTDLDIRGHIKPSGTIQINGAMSIDATVLQSGIQVQNTMHTSTGIDGKVVIRGRQLASVQINAPEQTTNLFSYDTNVFLIHKKQHQPIQPNKQVCIRSIRKIFQYRIIKALYSITPLINL